MRLSCTPVVVKLLLVKRSDAQTIASLDLSALVGAMLVVTSGGRGFRIRQVAEIVGREIRFTTDESVDFDAIAEETDLYWRHDDPCLIRDLCTELWVEGAVSLDTAVVQRTVERLCSAMGEEADPQALQMLQQSMQGVKWPWMPYDIDLMHELMQGVTLTPYDLDLHERAVASWRAHMQSSKINESS